ncbi:NAD-dependent protein deacylase [Rubripirellula obstinata]|uniref:NAD-dependent protein deacylase n=1 Tax=Rubripirellula obstinata TaxID=406547 RepID=A0A5B1CQV2_9BACT|nr:NAD-dependent deacylase [Rubripirellula obstinata]KAA1261763.1 NAD-dependent protein deacylase [Rubripirellula obstinata]
MNILILTGAGISAESGIPTFRDADGLWEGHAVEEVATPQGFARNPELVHQFYNERRRALLSETIQPNAAHVALADFERELLSDPRVSNQRCDFLLVTQNIDDLHARAGSQNVLPMHGELLKARCLYTEALFDWRDDLGTDTPHPDNPDDESMRGCLRPHVVWFGEMPIGLSKIEQAAANADVFIAIGTSGLVYPAAGIVQQTKPQCRKIEINLDDTPASAAFDETIRGRASEEVPRLLRELSN